MWLKVWVLLLPLCFGICGYGEEILNIRFLGLFNRSSISDVYFSCSVVGDFLVWGHNGRSLHTWHTSTSNLSGTHHVSNDNFNITTTLLSLKPKLESVLVLSFHGTAPSKFPVTCSSNHNSSTIDEISHNSTIKDSSGSVDVFLKHILTISDVVNGTNTYVHIFNCEAAGKQQVVTTGGSSLGFVSKLKVGKGRPILSTDKQMLDMKIILLSRNSFHTTSIVFIRNNTDFNVTCSNGNHNATLCVKKTENNPISPASPGLEPEPPTNSSYRNSTIGQNITEEELTDMPQDSTKFALFTLMLILLIPSLIVACCICYRINKYFKEERAKKNEEKSGGEIVKIPIEDA